MNLSNKVFELVDNKDGLAGNKTKMVFDSASNPYKATYTGENIQCGNVLVTSNNKEMNMIYHALTGHGELVAGKAIVHLSVGGSNKLKMELNWQWLTGDLSSGTSQWVEINT